MIVYLITAAALLVYLLLDLVSGRRAGAEVSRHLDSARRAGADRHRRRGVVPLVLDQEAARETGGRRRGARNHHGGDELDTLLAEAEAKLGSSRLVPGASFGALPVIFLVGPQGGTKTSTIVNSGLEPELLAGQVFQDTAVDPDALGESVVLATRGIRGSERTPAARSRRPGRG